MTEQTSKKNQLLKGRENYLAWMTRLEALLTLDDVLTRTKEDKLVIIGDDTSEASKALKIKNEKTAKKYVISNCDDRVMHSINPNETFDQIIAKLNSTYGFGNLDPAVILNELREIKFHPSKDPSIILNEIDIKLAQLESAGGTISTLQMVQYMHDGLSGDPLRDSFWFNCKGAMNMAKLSTYNVESAGKYITQFWYSYKPNKHYETANLTGYEKRLCQRCKEAKRFKIMKTHNTPDCRIIPGEEKPKRQTEGNKEASDYALYHDSGTSTTMVNFEPNKSVSRTTKVYTAGKDQPPQIGTSAGVISLNGLELKVVQVPSFSKNLLSATQLSIEHGCKQIIEPWTAELTITKDGHTIATGSYDKEKKLIKINPSHETALIASHDDWITVHRKLGHAGSKLINNTLKASTGIRPLPNRFAIMDCEPCLVSKVKRGPISTGQKLKKYIADVIEIDLQGPFPLVASDGTHTNIKFIDSKSGWLYYSTVTNSRSNTVLDHFLSFKAKLERQSGRQIKRVRTDGGNEFLGEFLAYLELSGIIKEKGVAYTHHHPGKVERAHQTILRLARAMLKDSQLPPKYYNEAQRCASYLFNRMPHGSDLKSPYEHLFGRPPNLKHLKPFGVVCYAYVPPEKRNKLEDSGTKCRLLGYGDDFNTEEIKGYRLLREDDLSIVFSDNVTFDRELRMEKLHEDCYSGGESPIMDSLWEPFISKSEDSISDEFFSADEGSVHSERESLESAMAAVTDETPIQYKDAMKSKDAHKWKEAMDIEIENIRRNNTYTLKRTKHGEKAIGCRWIFKLKLNPDGTILKYKARLVAKGFLQKKGLQYNETFAPVAKFKSIRILLAIASNSNWEVYHDDATSAFLNGILKEKVVMDQPEGYVEISNDYKWELLKALYGLKQAPREWNEVLHEFLVEKKFTQCVSDPCIYVRRMHGSCEIIGVYVDDVLSTGSDPQRLSEFRKELKQKFKCSEGGLAEWCLGMKIDQTKKGIMINQNQYIRQKLETFAYVLTPNTKRKTPLDPNFHHLLEKAEHSIETEPNFPYRSIVGSLMYAATGTRPDIMTAVGIVSRFNSSPKKIHCDMVRQILYYLRAYPQYALQYPKGKDLKVTGYSDSSWGNNEDYSSITGFLFLVGGALITWSSKKQSVVALSSTEAEYVAATAATQEALWIKMLLSELGINQDCVTIFEDNEACINLSKNPQEFKRTRHIQVKYHFIRTHVKNNLIALKYCPTKDQLADFLTKGVNGIRLQELMNRIGVCQTIQQEGELNIPHSLPDTPGHLGWIHRVDARGWTDNPRQQTGL